MTRWAGLHGVAGAQRWTPKLLGTTLKLWFDADDESTITIATGVSEWRDKSGGARHATEGTGGNQPVRTTNALNGRAVITFDGSNDRLRRTSGDSALTVTSRSFFLVCKLTNATGERCQFDVGSYVAVTQSGTTGRWYDYQASTFTFPGANTAYMLSIVQDTSSGDLRIDGGTASATGASVGFTGNGAFGIGSIASAGLYWQGDIAELLYCDTKLGNGDRQKLEGYLAWRWGLNGNLPSDHPYKNYAP